MNVATPYGGGHPHGPWGWQPTPKVATPIWGGHLCGGGHPLWGWLGVAIPYGDCPARPPVQATVQTPCELPPTPSDRACELRVRMLVALPGTSDPRKADLSANAASDFGPRLASS